MDEIVDFLQSVPDLSAVPREQLEWLVRESELYTQEPGVWGHPGDVFEYLLVILEGQQEAYAMQNGQRKTQMNNGPGAFSGLIPFSRMKASPVFVEAIGQVRMLRLHRSRFPDLIAHNYELTEVLVNTKVDRVRLFTKAHFQNEKLMALGKLSAGLAHELNNPAAAVVRSADDLKNVVNTFAASLQVITLLQPTREEIESFVAVVDKVLHHGFVRLPLLERKRRENDISDWLADHNVPSDCDETFTDAGITIDDLEHLKHAISERSLQPFLRWLGARLQTEKAVNEIIASSRRISELVQSVKELHAHGSGRGHGLGVHQ